MIINDNDSHDNDNKFCLNVNVNVFKIGVQSVSLLVTKIFRHKNYQEMHFCQYIYGPPRGRPRGCV